MKMLQGYVLVTEIEKEKKTASGIILTDPDAIDKSTQPALVLATSPEVDEMKTVVVGDHVYLNWQQGQPVTIEGEKAAIIHYEHIKAIL